MLHHLHYYIMYHRHIYSFFVSLIELFILRHYFYVSLTARKYDSVSSVNLRAVWQFHASLAVWLPVITNSSAAGLCKFSRLQMNSWLWYMYITAPPFHYWVSDHQILSKYHFQASIIFACIILYRWLKHHVLNIHDIVYVEGKVHVCIMHIQSYKISKS